MSLPAGFPSQAGTARNQAILAALSSGQATFSWSSVTSTIPGHTGTFSVFTDGLKIGGVRVGGSATLCQTVADMIGGLLQTPKLNDLAWLQAQVVIPPQTTTPTQDTATVVKESSLIDTAVDGRGGLVAPIGKPWVICKAITTQKAALYGWQSNKALSGIPLYAGVTSGIKVVQPLSTAHNPNYEDYSSLVNLVSRNCLVDGVARDLVDILQDPVLASLVSHEGALPNVRQPGVPVAPMLSTPPLASVAEPVAYVQPGILSGLSFASPSLWTVALTAMAGGAMGWYGYTRWVRG